MLDTMCRGLLAGARYPAYKARRRAREVAAFMAVVRARLKGGEVLRDASVRAERATVCAAGNHAPQCEPDSARLAALDIGPAEGVENGAAGAFRNAGVTLPGVPPEVQP